MSTRPSPKHARDYFSVMAYILAGPALSIKDISDFLVAPDDKAARVYVDTLIELGLLERAGTKPHWSGTRMSPVDVFRPIKRLIETAPHVVEVQLLQA